jgi:hypothetical protein
MLLPVVVTGWNFLRWVTLHLSELQDQRPIDVLRGGTKISMPADLVIEAARETAQGWNR